MPDPCDVKSKEGRGEVKIMKNKLIVAAGVLTAIVAITLCGWIMFSPSVEDGTKTMLGFVIALVAIVVHIIAISMVKKGSLTVYSSWKDFGLSCAWPISAIVSVIVFFASCMIEGNGARYACMIGGGVLAVISVVSMIWMFVGAFTNNKGRFGGGLIALLARLTATLFFLTYVGKLLEVKNGLHDSNVGVGDYVKAVIGFIIFGIWFKFLIVPLVKDNREELIDME